MCHRDPGGGGTVSASELSRCRRQLSPAGSARLPWQGQGWGEDFQEAGMTFHRYKLFLDPSPHFPSPPRWYLPLLSQTLVPNVSANPAPCLPDISQTHPSLPMAPTLSGQPVEPRISHCSWGHPHALVGRLPTLDVQDFAPARGLFKSFTSCDVSSLGGSVASSPDGTNSPAPPARTPPLRTPGSSSSSSRPSPGFWKFPEGSFLALRTAD